jgi:uncharacterized membrane protein YheB (UPF0754 family)
MKFVVSAVIGAIIGYITNWLAIKMLFRPHKEIRVFGIRVPFTPGLIPKERYRISKSVGETVGTHLLSNETIVEALTNSKIKEQISEWIRERIDSLRNNSTSIGDYIKHFAKTNGENIISRTEKRLAEYALKQVKSERFRNRIIEIIERELLSGDLAQSDLYKKIKENTRGYVRGLTSSSAVKDLFYSIINHKIDDFKAEEKSLNELIPSEGIFIVKQYIYQNESNIAEAAAAMLENESTQSGIRTAVEGFVEQSLGKLVTMFVKPEFVSGKIIEGILKYINNPENHPQIAGLVTSLIDRMLEKKASDLLKTLTPDIQSKGIEGISNMIAGYADDEENHDKLINIIEVKISENEENIKHEISEFIREKINEILQSDNIENLIGIIIKQITESLVDKPVSSIFEFFDDSMIDDLINSIESVIDDFIKNKAVFFAELLDVEKLVENKINEFDVEFAEKIIIDISSRELSAITWLGALLGGIIGILSPLVQNIF